ncbi:BTAD domain-containing putative transcriptional regulator [Streptomyces sp. B6B3]|uniref:AfsR/SARP family transcriptional regulator n=1 Tax=Streptomyces sp. B6B3 TaxID=3153570 RepID=UPI00325F5915
MPEIRLLGTVEVRAPDNGRAVAGPQLQRSVLAILAMVPGRPVTAEALIDRVWGHQPPENARDVLYTYVSRLRRLLREAAAPDADDAAGSVRRVAGGYLLDVRAEDVDLHRARALAASARELRDRPGGAEPAAELLREATELWRGVPLSGLKGEWAQRVRASLEQELVTMLTDRFDLELRLGRHADAVGGLLTALLEHPLVEPLTGQLMLALYRSGRQSDALEAYARTRRLLVAELGEGPGRALSDLHQRILRQDPTLDHRPDAGPADAEQADAAAAEGAEAAEPRSSYGPAIRPAQLPPDVAGFTGRADCLERLDRHLDAMPDEGGGASGPAVITAIVGTAGIGKTTLAVHWAHQAAPRFPDGQLYVNLRGFDPSDAAVAPETALRGLLEAFHVPPARMPAGLDELSALFRSVLAGRRVLLVLDNARDEAQVRPLLPGAPGCLTVVTSRNQLPGLVAATGASQLSLEFFTPEDVRALLAHRLGADRLAAESAAVDEIATRSARLPLALALVAAHAAARPGIPLSALVDELRTDCDNGPLDALSSGDTVTDMRAVFSWSYRLLSPETARLFRLIGLHPGPELATRAAASLAGLPVARTRTLLRQLAGGNLIGERAGDRYTVHDLLHAYASELADATDPEAERRAAVRRVLDYYLHSTHAACLASWRNRDQMAEIEPPEHGVAPERCHDAFQALDWFTEEWRTLGAAVRLAVRTGHDRHAAELGLRAGNYLDRNGHWPEQAELLETVVAATRRLGDTTRQAQALCDRARAQLRLGRLDGTERDLTAALELYRADDDLDGQAATHHYFGYLSEHRGALTEARDHMAQALGLYQATGNGLGEGRALNGIGWTHGRLGDHERSLNYCRRALAIQQRLGDAYALGITWDSLARAHHAAGDWDEAVRCYRRALDMLQSPDGADPTNLAMAFTGLGDTHDSAGDRDAARDAWRRALRVWERLRHPEADRLRARLSGDG